MAATSPSARRRLARKMKPEERPCYAQRPIVAEVTVEFPMPPSANKLYANGTRTGRVKTTAYRAWRSAAVLAASVKRPGRIAGMADVRIHLPPFTGDTDNRIKPCLDAAKELGVIADDGGAFIRNIAAVREPAGDSVRLVLTAVPVDEEDAAEVLVRTREGQTSAYIAVALGLSEGQVLTVLAEARR